MSLIPFLLFCAVTTEQPLALPGHHGSDPSAQPLLIYFSGENCSSCTLLDQLFQQPETLERMESQFVSVRVNINETVGKACAEIYDIHDIPAFVIADHKGLILYKSESASLNDLQYLLDHEQEESDDTGDSHNSLPAAQAEMQDETTAAPIAAELSLSEVRSQPEFTVQTVSLITSATPNTDVTPPLTTPSEISKPSKTEPAPVVAAKTPVTPKKPQVASKNYSYSIQLGYFSEPANAEKLQNNAVAKGLEAFTQNETHGGKPFYRVMIGRTTSLAEAQKILETVHRVGLKGAVYRK